jgi:hypothetical protein
MTNEKQTPNTVFLQKFKVALITLTLHLATFKNRVLFDLLMLSVER